MRPYGWRFNVFFDNGDGTSDGGDGTSGPSTGNARGGGGVASTSQGGAAPGIGGVTGGSTSGNADAAAAVGGQANAPGPFGSDTSSQNSVTATQAPGDTGLSGYAVRGVNAPFGGGGSTPGAAPRGGVSTGVAGIGGPGSSAAGAAAGPGGVGGGGHGGLGAPQGINALAQNLLNLAGLIGTGGINSAAPVSPVTVSPLAPPSQTPVNPTLAQLVAQFFGLTGGAGSIGGSTPGGEPTMGFPAANPTIGVGGTPQGTPAPGEASTVGQDTGLRGGTTGPGYGLGPPTGLGQTMGFPALSVNRGNFGQPAHGQPSNFGLGPANTGGVSLGPSTDADAIAAGMNPGMVALADEASQAQAPTQAPSQAPAQTANQGAALDQLVQQLVTMLAMGQAA